MTSAPLSTPPKNRWVFVGVILMSLSLLLWVCLLGVPFLPMSAVGRGTVATALIVLAEVAFWVGAVIVGPAATRRMRSWWRRSGDDARLTAEGPEPVAKAPLHSTGGGARAGRRHSGG